MKVALNGSEIDFSLGLNLVVEGKKNGFDIGDMEKLAPAFMSPELVGDAVWAVYQKRLVAAGIETKERLFELLTSAKMREVEAALKEAVSDFFTWGPALMKAVDRQVSQIDKIIEKATANDSGNASGDVPESSESTPVGAA